MTRRPLRVAVLSGGPSREHDVSTKSGAAVARALQALGHQVLPVAIGKDSRWTLPDAPAQALAGASETAAALARPPAAALAELSAGDSSRVDVVFVALHGPYGEDGTVQGFLETAGVPYTGSGVAASALAMDKERTKEVLVHHGLRTAPWVPVDRESWSADSAAIVRRVAEVVGWPAVVKPPRDGSSFGVSVVHSEEDARRAVESGLESADARVLVERRIEGIEVTCPVLGNRRGPWRTLPLVEIVPRDREFFDFQAKYEGASQEICPARIGDDIAARVRADAVTAHRVLGCDGVSRSDFIVDASGQPWFLETNTVPGMTEQSLCPLSAKAAGIEFARFCEMLVELGLER